MSEAFISRWGIPEADDYRWLHIPGFIMRHWSKFVSIQEWAFILQVMSFKFDSVNGSARPSMETIQKELGYKTIRSVQTIKNNLIEKGLLSVTEHLGFTNEYNFQEFATQCRDCDSSESSNGVNQNTGVGVNQNTGVGVQPDSPKEIESKNQKDKNQKDSALDAQSDLFPQDNADSDIPIDNSANSVSKAIDSGDVNSIALSENKNTSIGEEAEAYLANNAEIRKRLFAGICKLSFGLDPDKPETEEALKANKNALRKRIQKIVSWLLALDNPATPDELWEFYKWWPKKYANLSAPCDYGKFARYYIIFRQDESKSSDNYHHDPNRKPREEDYQVSTDYEIDEAALDEMIERIK